MARPTINLVDITRSSEGKLFESSMYVHVYEAQKAKGKLENWIPKSQIDSIKTEVDEKSTKDTIEIVPLEDDDSVDFELMSLDELKAFADENEVEYSHLAKESGIIKKLKAAGY